MSREAFKLAAPPSPPPTHPISTSSLPEVDTVSPSDGAHDLLDQEEASDFRSPHFDALTPSSQSSCSTLQSPPPLSPVSPESPEWFPPNFTFPAIRLASSQFGNGLLHSSIDALHNHFGDSDGDFLHDRRLDTHEPTSPKHPAPSLLSTQLPEYCNRRGHSIFSSTICESPRPILQHLEFEDSPFPLLPFFSPSLDADSDGSVEQIQAPGADEREAFQMQQQKEPEDPTDGPTYAHAAFPYTNSPSIRGSSLPELDDLGEMDLDFPDFLDKPPSSPSRRSYSALPDDDQAQDDSPSTCPVSDRDTSTDTLMLSPESPSLTLLALPGADADENLISLDPASTKPPSNNSSLKYANPLLVLDDDPPPQQDLIQRSPSPEPCTMLDINLLTPQIPECETELKKVCGLLKRTRDKERAAKQMESIVEEEEKVTRSLTGGAGGKQAVDAWNKLMVTRRKTRKMKERVREVATLLRLKLAQRGWKIGKDESGNPTLIPLSPPDSRAFSTILPSLEDEMRVDPQQQRSKGAMQKKQRITSPQQLVVKMIMDRNEPRYNPNLRAGIPLNRKASSPLARSSMSASREEVENDLQDAPEDVSEKIPGSPFIPEVAMGEVNEGEGGDLDGLDMDVDLEPLGVPER